MFNQAPTHLQGYGFQPFGPVRQRCINRTGGALAQGSVVMLDFAQSDGDVTNYRLGDKNSSLANVVVADAHAQAGTRYRALVVLHDDFLVGDLADNAAAWFTIQGWDVPVLCQQGAGAGGAGTSALDQAFGIDAGDTVLTDIDNADLAAGDLVVAQAQEVGVTITAEAPALVRCMFNGQIGFTAAK